MKLSNVEKNYDVMDLLFKKIRTLERNIFDMIEVTINVERGV